MKPVLVDTCVWVRHFRQGNPLLTAMLEDGEIWCHPIIIGELSLGTLKNREQTILDLLTLGRPPLASFSETRRMIDARKLWGRGIGWNDAQLLASAIIGGIPLWTFDLRLKDIAADSNVDFSGV